MWVNPGINYSINIRHFTFDILSSGFRNCCITGFMLIIFSLSSTAQISDDLNNIRVEELTDDQMRSFIISADRKGMGDEAIEQMALSQGMSPVELVKFKNRIKSVRSSIGAVNNKAPKTPEYSRNSKVEDSIIGLEQAPVNDYTSVFAGLKMKNFGFEVFNNPRSTFQPNLRLPTPLNYRLAADDELLIDVSGYSEANYRLKVSPEGIIRIPVAGPVSVNGLTLDQAKKQIIAKLSNTIYSNIKTGRTRVDVNLASIRSIQVTIIGEATFPGTYTLPSVASAYNALYACAGPNSNGSFRDIQIIRNNKVVAVIDVYQYLLLGNKKNDIRLVDQDVIKINTYAVRIELKGEVKKPGLYDVAKGETVGQIIRYAGGFTDNAYTARVQVFKNTDKERKVTTASNANLESIVPEKGDTYIIGKILNRFSNRISISGAVYRPGEYEMREGMTLTQLITEADGIREDAYMSRANIHRLKDDLSPEIIAFDLDKLLKGEEQDITLRKEDRVVIFSKFDLKEGYFVSIEGEVARPGIFLYEEGMTVQDVILMSGGLREAALLQRIEISRRIKSSDTSASNPKTAIIFQQDISPDLRDTALARFVLTPFDEISVRPAPGYFVQKNVVIEGEVLFTGKYTLEVKKERISDLVKRAGGLTSEAYVKGAVLVRTKNLSKTERSNNEQGLSNLQKQNYQAGSPPALLEYEIARASQKKSENVGIDLERILQNPQSEFDMLLNDGDTLRVPKQLQTVRVNGEVLYPALVRYTEKYKFRDYIIGAGGFSERSSKKRSYVVYANGTVKGTKSFLFIKSYPRLTPGAEIYVPVRRERERLRPGEAISIGATLTTMVAILLNALNNK
ncbi:MAG: SLBB domain-containing protein [Chitinophagaceae bacterium]|nr:SLBB domain-containing protein [Chitinophagaceae bacterium]